MPYLTTEDNVKVFYNYRNLDSKKPLLFFVHGWMMDWTELREEIRYFSKKGYPLIYFDMRGHGKSEVPQDKERYHIDIIAKDILRIIERLRIKNKVNIIGHSFGGMTSLVFTLNHPSKVESLLLIDSSYKVPSELNFERLKIPLPAHDSYAYRFLSALIKNQKRFNYLISNDVKGFKKKIKDSTVRFFLKRLFEAPLPTTLYFIEQMYNLDIKTRLSEINVPTLILIGKQDEFFDQSTQKEMSSMIKGSRLIIDEGSHFNVCFEAIKISKQIEEFLKEMK